MGAALCVLRLPPRENIEPLLLVGRANEQRIWVGHGDIWLRQPDCSLYPPRYPLRIQDKETHLLGVGVLEQGNVDEPLRVLEFSWSK